MENFKSVIYNSVPLGTLRKGLIWVKSHFNLEFLGQSDSVIGSHDFESKRNISMLNWERPTGCDSLSRMMRNTSALTAQGTVYGTAQGFYTEGRKHSIHGMNKEALTTDGTLSYSALSKYLRDISNNTELKEQRINKYLDMTVVNDFYDNATPLLVTMLMKIHKLNIDEHTPKKRVCIKIPLKVALELHKTEEMLALSHLYDYIVNKSKQAGMSSKEYDTYVIYEEIKQYVSRINKDTLKVYRDDAGMLNDAEPIPILLDCYEMYDYDDGHNKSGKHFGDHFGFVNNLFIVPRSLHYLNRGGETRVNTAVNLVPTEENSINVISRSKGTINCLGMNDEEVALLDWCLLGNTRQTPFLCDQNITITSPNDRYRLLYHGDMADDNITLTSSKVKKLLNRFVSVHRLQQELYEAEKFLLPWLAQPATEVLEAHFWTHIERKCRLPGLGLMRATVPVLLHGEGVCITTDALKSFDRLTAPNLVGYIDSLLFNTAWYWGEYLLIHNVIDTQMLLRNLKLTEDYRLAPLDRAVALASATLGKAVPVSVYEDYGTFLAQDLYYQTKKKIPFGKIDIPQLVDYGYEVVDGTVMLGKLVTPSCIGLILGLDTPMLRGTPYSTEFRIEPAVQANYAGGKHVGYKYHDLWAMGTVNRWNGHDIEYLHPTRHGRHKIYAANDVSIAMPPVPPSDGDYVKAYVIKAYRERGSIFGDNFEWAKDKDLGFRWHRKTTTVLCEPEWHSLSLTQSQERIAFPTKIAYLPIQAVYHRATVHADFDIIQSDFQVVWTQAGVPLPGQQQTVSLLPEESAPEVETADTEGRTPD